MKLTETRKWILIIYAFCILIACTHVPWKEAIINPFTEGENLNQEWSCEYAPIWMAKYSRRGGKYYSYQRTDDYDNISSNGKDWYRKTGIDVERLVVELFALSVLAIIMFLMDGEVKTLCDKTRTLYYKIKR